VDEEEKEEEGSVDDGKEGILRSASPGTKRTKARGGFGTRIRRTICNHGQMGYLACSDVCSVKSVVVLPFRSKTIMFR
jgi:hypothetical protein